MRQIFAIFKLHFNDQMQITSKELIDWEHTLPEANKKVKSSTDDTTESCLAVEPLFVSPSFIEEKLTFSPMKSIKSFINRFKEAKETSILH